MPKSKVVFEVQNLNLWYNKKQKHALKDVSLKIPRQKVTALIGPSGCGKSTFLRCFNKMNDLIENIAIQGSIKFDQVFELIEPKNLSKSAFLKKFLPSKSASKQADAKAKLKTKMENLSPLELRTRVGMVFQKPNPFPMSVYDNVAYGPRSAGIKDKKHLDQIVQSSLKDAALWDEVKDNLMQLGSDLSGGQQQRLCIARAIAMEPEVLLMDEPTSALDPIATSKIETLINRLSKKYTIIIVTHSMQQAARISNRTAFFYLGKLVEFGSTKKVFTAPEEKLTADYISGRMG